MLYSGEARVAALSVGLSGVRAALWSRTLPPHTRARARARTHTVIAGTDGATMHPMYFNLRVLCFALLADGWAVLLSNSEPREPFYYHDESNLTQWERPI